MKTYKDIDALFGAPLNTLPKPNTPYKLKTWHVVAGIAVVGFAVYGVYSAQKNVRSKFFKVDKETP